MTWVKVCGLTREQDVVTACDAGADAVGLVLVSASPRAITVVRARELVAVATRPAVLLTHDASLDEARQLLEETGATGIQPYGRHASAVAGTLAAEGVLALLPAVPGEMTGPSGVIPLYDTPRGNVLGGTGETFDWSVLDGVAGDFVLAGGLGPDNVAAAIRRVRPWGVDASSSLEVDPGVKDDVKVAAFIQEARSA